MKVKDIIDFVLIHTNILPEDIPILEDKLDDLLSYKYYEGYDDGYAEAILEKEK